MAGKKLSFRASRQFSAEYDCQLMSHPISKPVTSRCVIPAIQGTAINEPNFRWFPILMSQFELSLAPVLYQLNGVSKQRPYVVQDHRHTEALLSTCWVLICTERLSDASHTNRSSFPVDLDAGSCYSVLRYGCYRMWLPSISNAAAW